MSVEAVLFDWGGTLTPWNDLSPVDAWRSFATAHQGADADALHVAEAARWAAVRDTARAFTIDHVLAAYRAFWEAASVTHPEAAPVLRELRGRGLKLGVLSSTAWPAAWHEAWLHRDGLLELFDGCVWSSDLEWTKPHPSAFTAVMTAVGVSDPGRCVFVGDRPHDDIAGAKRAGMRAVLVPHSAIPAAQQVPTDVEPDAVLHCLADLPELIAGW
jgi:FMN hydrolase / 5-amino-6-(5-phospho-D-ribitylamino)uracil phosphatase